MTAKRESFASVTSDPLLVRRTHLSAALHRIHTFKHLSFQKIFRTSVLHSPSRSDTPEGTDNAPIVGEEHVRSACADAQQFPWSDASLPAEVRAWLVVQAMTEDEKFAWLSGPMAIPIAGSDKPEGALGSAAYYPAVPRLGIPAQQQTDASLGVGNLANVRPGDNATALPSSLLLGATFNPIMARETGAMVGQEARAKGFNVQLAGGANLVREPRGGRNFEYVSEDPLLTGVIAGNSVAGIQSQGVVSTVKHFALNPQETGRVVVNSHIADQALHESDLLAFKIAIEIGEPGAVMPGYNLVNGEWASENAYLINTVLKGEWGYPGWVMSDWGATHSVEKAALAGLDVQSGANLDPEPYFAEPLRTAVSNGLVPQSRIDDMVHRQLRSLFAVGVIDTPPKPGAAIDYAAHRLLAQRSAEQGIVLLKNKADVLPLSRGANRIVVIGTQADIGVVAGGGSSAVAPIGSVTTPGFEFMGTMMEKVYHPSSVLNAIKSEACAAQVVYVSANDAAAAVTAAHGADAVIVVAEEWRSEGQDAQGLSLPDDQDALITAVAKANANTVVVLISGGPVTMPWLDDVVGVVAAFYPGLGGGEAIAGILFGRVNPSGRLPITFPQSVEQLPHPEQRDPSTTTSNPGEPIKGEIFCMDYNVEGADVGYRWFDARSLTPLFPFGYGLSYTRFEAHDFHVSDEGGRFVARFVVSNSGDLTGAYVAQVYVAGEGVIKFPKRLCAFERVELAPGESKKLELEIDPRFFARFDTAARQWAISEGTYSVRLADNAADPGKSMSLNVSARNVKP
ncbi:beta-glucosidase [Xanthomonas sp. WHRI 10064A]|uniref:beta-glucosidase n=1 Tax=unclassified Xanthomonas TaxID=2643310 RepID=UPI002B239BE6|nr:MULTISPECIES: beta-glucosidase [unclassified Xanthomonas]MEA9588628.1 beta-glucosidase [Xanthomonas sp. WHRI 10064B]MEA9613613.1 beta-glucosidase [Xanthomonas sp. WHRI 10064A]